MTALQNNVPVITIDGPSGTGKGTIAGMLAQHFNFMYLDSGALYRALAWVVLAESVDIENEDALKRCINAAQVVYHPHQVICNETDITAEIREEKTGMMASKIASNPLVRQRLMQLQREQRRLPGLVTDGRDMGTVVFPDAQAKIYLTASSEERAKRRYNQLKDRGIDVNLRDIEEELNTRDRQDTERAASPLKPAEDAVTVDTTALDIDQVFQAILDIVRPRLA